MKFAETLKENAVPEWKPKYVDYSGLKEKIIAMKNQGYNKQNGDQENMLEVALLQDEPVCDPSTWYIFAIDLETEVEKVRVFYDKQEEDMTKIYSDVMDALAGSHHQHGKRARLVRSMKVAMIELYQGLQRLLNFGILNYTAFVKITKKFQKNMNMYYQPDVDDFMERLRQESFVEQYAVKTMVRKIENSFALMFTDNDRGRAMEKLKGLRAGGSGSGGWLRPCSIGFMVGVAMCLLASIARTMMVEFTGEKHATRRRELDLCLRCFRMGAYWAVSLWIIGLNVYIWRKRFINFLFVMEIQPRMRIDAEGIFFTAAAFTFGLSTTTFLTVEHIVNRPIIPVVPVYTYGIVFLVVNSFFLFNPWRITFKFVRILFRNTLWRILWTPIFSVKFFDFFVADQLCSFVTLYFDFALVTCVIYGSARYGWTEDPPICTTINNWAFPLMQAFPYWIRFLQCLRHFFTDTRSNRIQVANASTYLVSLLTIVVSAVPIDVSRALGIAAKVLVIALMTFNALYSFVFDVYLDWNLVGKGGFFQRELKFRRTSVYVVGILFDLMGRFFWSVTLTLSLTTGLWPSQTMFMTLAGFVEVIRRCIWNLFRIENEHVSNCENYRAVRKVPIPLYEDMVSATNKHGAPPAIPVRQRSGTPILPRHSRSKSVAVKDSGDAASASSRGAYTPCSLTPEQRVLPGQHNGSHED